MEDLVRFKNKIVLYGILVMLIMEIISLPFLGFSLKFTIGLLLGTAIAIANLNILAISSVMILNGKNKFFASASYLIRLLLYGGVFYLAMKFSYTAGFASIFGFMTVKIAIIFLHGIMPRFKKEEFDGKGLKKERKQVLIKTPYLITYHKGRKFITYQKFVEYKR